jgi:hypothetical protein
VIGALEATVKNWEHDTPFNFDTPKSVTLLYLHYWYYCSIFFLTPPPDTLFDKCHLPVLYVCHQICVYGANLAL